MNGGLRRTLGPRMKQRRTRISNVGSGARQIRSTDVLKIFEPTGALPAGSVEDISQ